MHKLKTVFLLIGILIYCFSFAQKNSLETEAKVALLNYFQESDRNSVEIPEFQINSQSLTAPSGIHHYYFIQTIQDIPVYKALAAVHLDKNGKAISINSKMIDQSSYQRSFGNQNFGALEAIEIAVTSLGLVYTKEIATKNDNGMFVFDRKKDLHGPVLAEFMLLPFEEELIPAWRIEVMDMDHHVKWQIWVSDRDGDVILKESLTHYCAFDIVERKQNGEFNTERKSKKYPIENSVNFGPEATYQVLPFPTESPNHGDFEIIEEPWDLVASPYGWHDNNGFPGAETTSTSGNNVNTSLDRAGDGPSSFDEADGGAELIFVFPYDPEADPLDNAETAVTNMFYSINWMHDFSFKFGFDEASGNFQEKNYSGEGSGNDPVVSVVQNGFEDTPPRLNNASMATSSEGFPPFMENRLFDASFGGAAYLEISSPEDIADFYESTPAQFGADITTTPIIGEVVMIQDESSPVTDGCDEIVNGSEIAGKIAMIDRGSCEFGFKVLQAEDEGAIAVIICNNQPTGLVSMGGGVHGGQVTIPSIFISQSDCQKIRIYAGNSLECIIKAPEGSSGPEYLDGAFDNGIVAHEFGHGISNRLTGGPGQTGCLNNYEQMGEGISDFFTLVTTVKPGDDGSQPKGIGTYVARQETDGLGIRRFQYTTDMSVNPLTYDDIIGETSDGGIYAIGELWCSTLWDMYWLMSQAYGLDATYTDTSAGNYKTMMLVMEGMKLQACDPGFIDSRDAILLADETMYNSENSCIIWEAFSRRGLGMNADQNDADNPNDGTEDFSVPLSCIKELRINKITPDLIQPGEAFDIVLEVRNGLSAAQNNVIVTDELLDGLDFVSSDISPEITGNELKWTIPNLQPDEEWSVSYTVQSSSSLSSERVFIDSMENNNNWFPLINNGDDQFDLSDARPAGGNYSYHVPNTTLENDQQLLFLSEVVPGEHDWPVIRFDHYFDTEQGVDGGVLELSIDNASTWTDIGDRFISNPYTGRIDYSTFAIYKQKAFSGLSGDYQTSYIDISDFIGETVFLRFRFGSDEGHLKPDQYEGWYIDNFEIMDAKGFKSPACIISDESIKLCTDPDESVTLIDSRIINSIKEENQSSTLLVFPNPASDQINISSEWLRVGNPVVTLSTIDGERIYSRTGTVSSILSINTAEFIPGFYFLQIINNGISTTRKVIIGK